MNNEVLKRRRSRARTFTAAGVTFGAALVVAFAILAAFGALGVVRDLHAGSPAVTTSTDQLAARFAVLRRRHSNQCALKPQSVDSLAVRGRLQGSCCTPIVFRHYVKQVRGLAAYRTLTQIPRDPYDIPVAQARQLLAYDRKIALIPEQQAVYREAMKVADEHGPCCCHCWRWTTFEGQAKYLISRRGYTSRQIATVWDLEDGCGG